MGHSVIHETAIIEDGSTVGEGSRIWHFAHVRSGAVIGRDCVIGKDVYIDEGVVIGDRVKIQNGVSVYRGVTLADDVFVGPHVAFTNDLSPRADAQWWTFRETHVERGASIGANATIIAGVTIGPWAMVGAGSTVTRSVEAHWLVYGVPARHRGYACRCGLRLVPGRTCRRCGGEVTISAR